MYGENENENPKLEKMKNFSHLIWIKNYKAMPVGLISNKYSYFYNLNQKKVEIRKSRKDILPYKV